MFPQFPCPLSFFNSQPASGQSSKKNKKTSGRENVSQPTTNDNDNSGRLGGLFNRRINNGNKGKGRASNNDIDVSSYVLDSLRLDSSTSTATDPFRPPLRERRSNVSVNVGKDAPPRNLSNVPPQKRLNAGLSVIIESPFEFSSRGRSNSGSSGSTSSANVRYALPPLRRLPDVPTQNGDNTNSTTQGKYSLFLQKMKSDTKNFAEGASKNFSSIKQNLFENGRDLKMGLDNLIKQASKHISLIKEKADQAVSKNRSDLERGLKDLRRSVIYAGGNSYLTAHFKKPSSLDGEMKKALDKWKEKKELENEDKKDSDLMNLRVATLVDRIYKNKVRGHSYIDIERVRQSMLNGRKYDEHQISEEYLKIDELFFDEKFQSILTAYMPGRDLKKGSIYISPSQKGLNAGSSIGTDPFRPPLRGRSNSYASTVSVDVGDGIPARSLSDVPTMQSYIAKANNNAAPSSKSLPIDNSNEKVADVPEPTRTNAAPSSSKTLPIDNLNLPIDNLNEVDEELEYLEVSGPNSNVSNPGVSVVSAGQPEFYADVNTIKI